MGTKLKDISVMQDISFENLANKKVVIDSYNILYQFLTSIRARDGAFLMDSHGNVTSHLVGLFTRTAKLMQHNIKPGFIFDGKPPKLKQKERERRAALKEEASVKYKRAVEKKDVDEMKKYAARTTRLTRDMINEAKLLVGAMGLPVVQAPSEGEAQAAAIVNKGEAYACISQDFDSLLFGAKRLIQNLTVSERKKLPGKLSWQKITPRMIDLDETLNHLGINQEQLIVVGMLTGTDFNIGGIPGIGPKKALKAVRAEEDFEKIFSDLRWDDYFECSWKDVFKTISKMPITKDYKLDWSSPDRNRIIELLCGKHDFSEDRVNSTLDRISKEQGKKQQKGLNEWT